MPKRVVPIRHGPWEVSCRLVPALLFLPGELGHMNLVLRAAWRSQVCGSADFPRRTTRGAACGWPIVNGWTPAARACGTRPLSTSTSAPNTSRRTALSWWESGGPHCKSALGRGVGHHSRRQTGGAVHPDEEVLTDRQTWCEGCCFFFPVYNKTHSQYNCAGYSRETCFRALFGLSCPSKFILGLSAQPYWGAFLCTPALRRPQGRSLVDFA